jgi:predicted TIM-barrel fold metal-dependent hydrolase
MDQFPQLPQIISVDDHVIEPPDLWTSRLPRRFGDRVPHVERDRAKFVWENGHGRFSARGIPQLQRGEADGTWCDIWVYDNESEMPFTTAIAAIGEERPDFELTTLDDIHPWSQRDRLADMTADHIEASLCFPNLVPRMCGQTFYEGRDKELGLACVQAYNDWVLDEWCSGEGHGRLIPLTLIPLWDLQLALAEVERCAAKGTISVAFSENPYALGLPSIHSGFWDPLFTACGEANLVVSMHIGSSSHVPRTSPDAPHIISTCTHFSVTMGSMLDFIFSGTLDRIPGLNLFYAESQAGWVPHVLEQADWLWARRLGSRLGPDYKLPEPPSSYVRERIYLSIYNDESALLNRDRIGIDQLCFETDYPHSVSSFPHSGQIAEQHCRRAGLSSDEAYKLLRGNSIRAFGLGRIGITI